jgi:predicted transglutaminase-like cysteine proteinase
LTSAAFACSLNAACAMLEPSFAHAPPTGSPVNTIVAADGPAPAPLGVLEFCRRTAGCADTREILEAGAPAHAAMQATAAYEIFPSLRPRPDASSNFTMMLNRAALSARSDARAEEALTQPRWRELVAINRAVNRAIKAQSDADQYGVAERWSMPILEAQEDGAQARGDCEDYALEKRARLLAAGWAPAAVLLAVAELPGGGRHTVVIARTDRGDIVLDNLHSTPQPAALLEYAWISRQTGTSLSSWSQARLALLSAEIP